MLSATEIAPFIAKWQRIFHPDGTVRELRVLNVRGRKAVSEFFSDADSLAARAAELDRAGAKGCYFTVNPLKPDLIDSKASARKEDVSCRHWLPIDVDPVRPENMSGESSSEDERQAAWAVLDACRGTLDGAGMRGAVVGDSGNGWHLCYPIDFPNDDASQELVKAILTGLQARCGTIAAIVDKKCYDAPRIWKLYGTMARKGTATDERPHRVAALSDGQHWDAQIAASNNAVLPRLLTIWQAIADLHRGGPVGDIVARAKSYLEKADPAISGQGGHDRTYHLACVLMKDFALTVPQAMDAIQDWNARCQPPWSEKELLHKFREAAKAAGANGRLLNGSPKTEPPAVIIPKEIPADDVAGIEDLIRAGAEIRWLWPGWIQLGVLTVLAAEGGTGKTRLCADLIRRMSGGMLWPDQQTISLPENRGCLSLWVLSDNHHDEITSLSQSFGIVEAIRLNASRSDPYSGVTLESSEDLAELEGRIKAVKPLLVVIDTVGNATSLNLSKQEDAKGFYQPLQIMARRNSCAILCLTHLSASGTVLGRRAKEKVRVVIQMERPDQEDEKRRLWVSKSNSKYPPPLGVTMGDRGNEYDDRPPTRAEDAPKSKGRPSPQLDYCKEWLTLLLSDGPKRVSILRDTGETKGFVASCLYRAKDQIGAEEFVADGKKWWRLLPKGDAYEG